MASIRSITTSKPTEHLSNRRVNRSSTSIASSTDKKITNHHTKSSTSIVSNTQQQQQQQQGKSSRMTSKKDLFGPLTTPATIYSSRTISPMDNHDLPDGQMATLQLRGSSPRRPLSKLSSTTSEPLAQAISNSDKSSEEQQANDRSACSSASHKSSTKTPQFTVESFDTIRTVGTGKRKRFWMLLFFSLR